VEKHVLKKKIAFIIQLYGLEINGGAEYHCRLIAEKLKDIYDVEILTSCAKSSVLWENEYAEGVSDIDGVKVRRFPTDRPRDRRKLRRMNQKLRKLQTHQKVLRALGLLGVYEKVVPDGITDADYEKWMEYQGPFLPKLIDYIKKEQANYDALIFFTYLYYPTIEGLKIAPGKSILIPTAHDEWQIHFPLFEAVFTSPKAILYNTLSEKRLVNRLFNNENIHSAIAAVGIEQEQPHVKYNINELLKTDDDYIIYIGRVDVHKGCQLLCDHFLKYKNATGKPLKLIFAGKLFMEKTIDPDIIYMGFVDEDVKITLLQNAMALVIPSLYESLSLVTLESMAQGVPVIANRDCEVLKDHIENSKSGFLFNDYESFKTAMDAVLDHAIDKTGLIANGKKYVAENYTWDVTIQKYKDAVDYVSRH
jgi:glycosyltransferase involved in cell wall biosynthesis